MGDPPMRFAAARPRLLQFGICIALLALVPLLRAGPLGDAVQPYANKGALAGAVLLTADKTGILACEPVGCADLQSNTPMREDTLFWIASMTKSMTVACVMMLVDEGRLSLDDPVEKHIPAFNKLTVKKTGAPPATPVTIRHLLSNTSGCEYLAPEEMQGKRRVLDLYPMSQAVTFYTPGELRFEPGTNYFYGNINFRTAGRIIEIASGMSYADFVQKRLFDPLGMRDSTFWPDKKQLARLATAYRGDPDKNTLTPANITFFTYPLDDRLKRHACPAGGVFSTARDIAQFGIMLLNKGVYKGKRILSEKSVAEMTSRQTPPSVKNPYGLGLKVKPDGAYEHDGAYGTSFSVFPRDNLVTVFMVQRAGKWGAPDGNKALPAFIKAATTHIKD